MSAAIQGYWASFVKTGAPAADAQPAWKPYGEGRAFMEFGDAPRAAANLMPGMYELHETVVGRRRAQGDLPWNWNVGVVSPPLPPAPTEPR